MSTIVAFICIYLLLGVIYTTYLIKHKACTFLEIPINILGGPLMAVYIILTINKNKPLPWDRS